MLKGERSGRELSADLFRFGVSARSLNSCRHSSFASIVDECENPLPKVLPESVAE